MDVHAVAAPWIAFSVFGTIEQLTLPARPAVVDGLLIEAPALGIAWSIGRRAATELRVGHAHRADVAELTDRRRRLEAQVATVERARARRQLHDLVGHGLSLVSLRAAVGQVRLSSGETPVDQAVDEVQGLIAMTERELVELDQRLGRLAAPDLDAVRALVATAREHGQPVALAVEDGPVDPATAELVTDVVREALTNVRKHAGAAPTRVDVALTPALHVAVVNEPGAPTLGHGSRAGPERLREHAAALGAELTWGPAASGGWEVRLRDL